MPSEVQYGTVRRVGAEGAFGAATYWLRPPGFAHPVGDEEGVSVDDQPTTSYATPGQASRARPR